MNWLYRAPRGELYAFAGPHTLIALVLLIATTSTVTGCISTAKRKAGADKEVYKILEAKSPAVPGMVDEIDIEPAELRVLDSFPTNEMSYEYLGAEADGEVGAAILSLEDALEIAFTQSRDYQTRKERLYLEALSLTLDRHQFAPIFSASGSVDHVWSSRDVQVGAFREAVDNMTGSPGAMIQQYSTMLDSSGAIARGAPAGTTLEHERSVSGRGSVGFGMLLRGGGRLALNLTTSFTEFLSGGGADNAISTLSGSFVQPLLRGAGRDVNAEFLTQAERDVLYELRSFTRFRKTFAVDVARSYYNILRNRDRVSNDYDALESFELSFDRERAFLEVGLQTASQVARLETQVLDSDSRWTNSIVNYQRSLDNFKILLGFPTDAAVVLDDAELSVLIERGIQLPTVSVEEAIEIAQVTRLDLYTDRERVDDAFRRIKVAANALKADLDLVLTGAVDSKDGNRFASFDFERSVWTAGVDFDLPLDRKAERNNYRRALIDYEVSKRTADLATDTVKLQVRDAWRTLEQAHKDYEINLKQLDVNESRVEEITIRAEVGLGATILDQVDAQNDLTAAETALTAALVRHTIALLELWQDVGILYVKENGQWEEILDV